MITTTQHKLRDWVRTAGVVGGLRTFNPKIKLYLEGKDYRARTAENLSDLKKVLQLRHYVFCEEWRGQKNLAQFDLDQFDLSSDHILIESQSSNEVVGTYRIRSTQHNKKFYSDTEFDLSYFDKSNKHRIELGRACTHPQHRNGNALQYLWRGVAEYLNQSNAEGLFGCSSMIGLNKIHLGTVQMHLIQNNAIDLGLLVAPKKKLDPRHHSFRFKADHNQTQLPPPLMDMYLKLGAKVAMSPAVDVDFDCIDWFTVLDRSNMHPTFRKRYGL